MEQNNLKREILNELDSRISRLKEHKNDDKSGFGGNHGDQDNQYEQLNHSLSRVIGVSLEKELENLRDFVEEL